MLRGAQKRLGAGVHLGTGVVSRSLMGLQPGDLHDGSQGQQKQEGSRWEGLEQKPFLIPATRLNDIHIRRHI